MMTAKSADLSETFISGDRADSWRRGKQRRAETYGPATELMLDLAEIRTDHRVLDVAAGTGGQTVMKEVSTIGFGKKGRKI
jgi:ubiquinone/menaquinone biosynthesis C-methylase UbiE